MLYKVFIDDSGSKDYKTPYTRDFVDNPPHFSGNEEFWRNNYFVLCGVRIKHDDIKTVNTEIDNLKRSYFGTHNVEIKSTLLRIPASRKKYYLEKYDINVEKLNRFGNEYIDLIAQHSEKLKLIGVVFDKRYFGDKKRNSGDGNPLLKTAQVLMERIQYIGDENTVIFDQFEDFLSSRKGNHGKLKGILDCNDGIPTSFIEHYHNITDVVFKESRKENFLQMADVCAYNIYRQFVEFGREWCGERKTDGEPKMGIYSYFYKLRGNFHANNSRQQVRGVGLTCLPTPNKINWNLSGPSDNSR